MDKIYTQEYNIYTWVHRIHIDVTYVYKIYTCSLFHYDQISQVISQASSNCVACVCVSVSGNILCLPCSDIVVDMHGIFVSKYYLQVFAAFVGVAFLF